MKEVFANASLDGVVTTVLKAPIVPTSVATMGCARMECVFVILDMREKIAQWLIAATLLGE